MNSIFNFQSKFTKLNIKFHSQFPNEFEAQKLIIEFNYLRIVKFQLFGGPLNDLCNNHYWNVQSCDLYVSLDVVITLLVSHMIEYFNYIIILS